MADLAQVKPAVEDARQGKSRDLFDSLEYAAPCVSSDLVDRITWNLIFLGILFDFLLIFSL